MSKIAQLPEQFRPLIKTIESTLQTCVEFDREEKSHVHLWQSNLGMYPYFPLESEYPCSQVSNEPLQFLAQINFSEIPQLDGFPEKGIVQFYLNMKAWDLGMDESLEHVQLNHRVLYFPEVNEDESLLKTRETLRNFSEISEDEAQLWVDGSALAFNKAQQYMTFFDYRFAPLLFNRQEVYVSSNYEDILHAYQHYQMPYTEDFQSEGGHRIGGYANYLHSTDNRTEFGIEDHLLLMQLDTDEGLEWCDSGIAQWYIHPDDLKQCDFSKVVFLWACH